MHLRTDIKVSGGEAGEDGGQVINLSSEPVSFKITPSPFLRSFLERRRRGGALVTGRQL